MSRGPGSTDTLLKRDTFVNYSCSRLVAFDMVLEGQVGSATEGGWQCGARASSQGLAVRARETAQLWDKFRDGRLSLLPCEVG